MFFKDQTLRYLMVVDGHFLTDKVNTIYQNKKFPKIPFMTGVNDDEGGWLLPGVSTARGKYFGIV